VFGKANITLLIAETIELSLDKILIEPTGRKEFEKNNFKNLIKGSAHRERQFLIKLIKGSGHSHLGVKGSEHSKR
jgi:hypothetical protein